MATTKRKAAAAPTKQARSTVDKPQRGGARPGAGRKATGAGTVQYTVTIPRELDDQLREIAAAVDATVPQLIRDFAASWAAYAPSTK